MGIFNKLFGKPAQPKILVEQRDWVMAYEVPTDGWTVQDTARPVDDGIVRVLKLVRGDDNLTLLAKDYESDEGGSLEQLRARDWAAQYAPVFPVTGFRVTDAEQTLMDRVVPALDVFVEGAEYRIRERYAYVPGHQLILTAIGLTSAHERFAAEVAGWFERTAFRPR